MREAWRVSTGIISASVAVVLAACGRSNDAPTKPIEPSPTSLPAGLVFKGSGGSQTTDTSAEWGRCWADRVPGGLEVWCESAFAYTLAIGTQRVEGAAHKASMLLVDLVPAFGRMKVVRDGGNAASNQGTVAFEAVDPATTVKVTFADGKTLEGPLVPVDRIDDLDALRQALKKPLTFGPDEAPHPPDAKHSIVFVGDDPNPSSYVYGNAHVIGPAATLHEVDWVALSSDEVKDGGRKCGGYTVLGGGGPESEVPLMLVERTLIIKDRRTGTEISRKSFLAPKQCPSAASSTAATSYPDRKTGEAWLASELTKH